MGASRPTHLKDKVAASLGGILPFLNMQDVGCLSVKLSYRRYDNSRLATKAQPHSMQAPLRALARDRSESYAEPNLRLQVKSIECTPVSRAMRYAAARRGRYRARCDC